MIDLHTHTNESDGTTPPEALVDEALSAGLQALGITDHDTFNGFDQALPRAQGSTLDLVCGIELSTRFVADRRLTVHLLGYFPKRDPGELFRDWVLQLQESRRDRNRRLILKLQSLGVDIELAEIERIGRTLTGRPHFARVLVEKGYAASSDEAFRKYLGETAAAYVEREGPDIADAIDKIRTAGGISVLAHPVRLGYRDPITEEACIARMRDSGLQGIEVYHSDHDASDVARYAALAKKYNFAVTGGSDYHGDNKPRISLGSGYNGNVQVPFAVLEALRN